MKTLLFVAAMSLASSVFAESIVRIEYGKDYSGYTHSELQRRVWDLEKAVFQLQQRVFQLEVNKPAAPTADSWVCTMKAMNETYSASGPTKAVAKNAVLEKCKAANDNSSFFCKDPKCEQ